MNRGTRDASETRPGQGRNVARELSIDTTMEAADVEKAVNAALDGGLLVLSDSKGRRIVVPGTSSFYASADGATWTTITIDGLPAMVTPLTSPMARV